MQELGYGEGYGYAHNHDKNFIPQEYLPNEISGTSFYIPGKNKREDGMREFLLKRWKDKYQF